MRKPAKAITLWSAFGEFCTAQAAKGIKGKILQTQRALRTTRKFRIKHGARGIGFAYIELLSLCRLRQPDISPEGQKSTSFPERLSCIRVAWHFSLAPVRDLFLSENLFQIQWEMMPTLALLVK